MLAYKITAPGLVSTHGQRGRFNIQSGVNYTPEANCARNGFHAAEDPLDCFNYYSRGSDYEYYLVDARGDIDETNGDTKLACTELEIIRRLSLKEFIAAALIYARKYPNRPYNTSIVSKEKGTCRGGFAVVRGKNPKAAGSEIGDLLALIKETSDGVEIALIEVDGERILPDVFYNIEREAV